MKTIFTLIIILTNIIYSNSQDNKKLLDYFPDLQNRDTVINSAYLWDMLDTPKK
jgi:hypothetical protein